eukprot:162716_1
MSLLLYKKRLNLLSFGYARSHKIHGVTLPDEVMELLFLWLKSKPRIVLNQICNAPRFQLELHLDDFSSNILTNDEMYHAPYQYEIQYIEYTDTAQDIKQFIDTHPSMMHTTRTANIYKTNWSAFVEINTIGSAKGFNYLIKIIARAKGKECDAIICESPWQILEIGFPFLRIAHHNKQECAEYFEEYVDGDHSGCITMDEWIAYCTKSDIGLKLKDIKRAFHFMEYLKRKDHKSRTTGRTRTCVARVRQDGVNKNDFINFVCHNYYNMYLDHFRDLIDKFKDKINASASDIDDDYVFVFT